MAAVLLLVLSVPAPKLTARPAAAPDPFPHAAHAGLFPLCTGCHEGIATGQAAQRFPAPALCGRCHDGRREGRVTWTSPRTPTRGAWFDHRAHAAALRGRASFDCADCHIATPRERMRVERLVAGPRCEGCHEQHHRAESRCRACHAEPGPGVHDLAVHAGCAGSGCHERAPGAEAFQGRELCLVCHRAMVGHEPGGVCAECHRVS